MTQQPEAQRAQEPTGASAGRRSLLGWLRGGRRSGEEAQGAAGLPVPRGPRPTPFVGNMRELQGGFHGEAFLKTVAEHGGIFSMHMPAAAVASGAGTLGRGQPTVVLTDPLLIEEMFNRHEDFQKRIFKHSPEIRAIAADGLFTADDDEPIHDQAARILLPAFSMSGMKGYFDIITTCTELLCDRFASFAAAGDLLDLHPLLSQYTLEVIGRVGFGVEFNAMAGENEFLRLLNERNEISIRIQKSSRFATVQGAKGFLSGDLAALDANRKEMGRFVWDVINRKKQNLKAAAEEATGAAAGDEARGAEGPKCPVMGKSGRCPVKDMAERMLTHPDPKTGEHLPDSNIEGQVVTFLIAGHDSTSSAITCLLYHLALNPDVEEKVYREVMEVVGPTETLSWEHLGRMPYCLQVVKENLRLCAPATEFTKTSPPDRTTTLGPYQILPGTDISVPTWGLHRSPSLWPNPNKFDPDRFSEEASAGRSPYAWLPFSYGRRGCIGQQLSLLEQRVALVEIVRRFHLRVDPSTRITWEEPLFLDPQGIFLTVTARQRGAVAAAAGAAASGSPPPALAAAASLGSLEELRGKRSLVLFGSNMGTCDELADRLVAHDAALGMACEKATLNDLASGAARLPSGPDEGVVAIVASSYNGLPPDNASEVESWLESLCAAASCTGVHFAIFGCGNKQWAGTYMAFPRRLQAKLEALSATPLVSLGEGDMDGGQVEGAFAAWNVRRTVSWLQANKLPIPECVRDALHPSLPVYDVALHLGKSATALTEQECELLLDESLERAQHCFLKKNKAFLASFACNLELVALEERSTRHVEVALEPGTSYRAGDHLGVWGANPDEVVTDYMGYLNLDMDAVVTLDLPENPRQSLVPLKKRLDLWSVLAYYIELQQPASRAQLRALSKFADEPAERSKLEQLSEWDSSASAEGSREGDMYVEEVLSKRRTLLEMLREFPSARVPVGALLGMLPPMKPRYYSISSSPRVSPDRVSITVSVVKGPSPSGRQHVGICSNHLKNSPRFWPVDGAAPLPTAAFVKDTGSAFRLPTDPATPVIMVGPGTGVAPMRGFLQDRAASGVRENVLFFGCRGEDDFLYREELEGFQATGFLRLFVAFSRKAGVPKAYVQHLIAEQADLMRDLLGRGAHVYVCGDASKMAPDVRAAFAEILGGAQEVEDMVARARYCEDVWAAQSV